AVTCWADCRPVLRRAHASAPAARPDPMAGTVAAIVSGLAPGSDACTEIVGKSICGSGATGKFAYPRTPASAIAAVSSVVATGRTMKVDERFIAYAEKSALPLAAGDKALPKPRFMEWAEGEGCPPECAAPTGRRPGRSPAS